MKPLRTMKRDKLIECIFSPLMRGQVNSFILYGRRQIGVSMDTPEIEVLFKLLFDTNPPPGKKQYII